MEYRVIGDSCTDLPKNLKKDPHFRLVPLTLIVGDMQIVDNDTFDQLDFLRRVKECSESPKSACPSPEDYMKEFEFDGEIYIVTLSSALSGSNNSAELAKKLFHEKQPDKQIGVIDSCSASVGQTLIAMKIKELKEKGFFFEKVMEHIVAFRDEMHTKFVLENMDTLRKNGRLSSIQSIICNVLNIKPVMGSTAEGVICKLDQARGIKKALLSMVRMIEKDVIKPQERILAIAHCNHYERAIFIKDEIMKRIPFKSFFITDTAGVSSMYANEGGIIVTY
jgi:DegV family protein with EDD domain